jgi:hypothetical protein
VLGTAAADDEIADNNHEGHDVHEGIICFVFFVTFVVISTTLFNDQPARGSLRHRRQALRRRREVQRQALRHGHRRPDR